MADNVIKRDHLDLDIGTDELLIICGIGLLVAVMSGLAAPMASWAQAQVYSGRTCSRTHNATEALSWEDFIHEWPESPLVSAFIINDGPHAVEVAVNDPNSRLTMGPNETRTIARIGAMERIAIIFFKCAPGEWAHLRIEGEY